MNFSENFDFGNAAVIETTETTTTTTTTETTTVSGAEELLRGDVDCSGKVAVADAVLLARYLAEDKVTVTATGLINAELTDSTALDSADLAYLLQMLAGLKQ